ncbi:hypothetical protein AGMMS50218_15210 [Actinomycetota bacterium]|nr:hypothetical protein AGMMS50218_15210 [Actinomycetota bacterium]
MRTEDLDPVLHGFGLDFTWVSDQAGQRLSHLAGGLVAAALVACGVAVVLGVVTVMAGKAGLKVGARAEGLASGAVTVGVVGALVLAVGAAAMEHYAGITVGW